MSTLWNLELGGMQQTAITLFVYIENVFKTGKNKGFQ